MVLFDLSPIHSSKSSELRMVINLAFVKDPSWLVRVVVVQASPIRSKKKKKQTSELSELDRVIE